MHWHGDKWWLYGTMDEAYARVTIHYSERAAIARHKYGLL